MNLVAKAVGALTVALLLVLGGAGGGWVTRGWHDDAKTLKAHANDLRQLNEQFTGVVTASNTLAATILAGNQVTDRRIGDMVTALGAQNHVFTQLRLDITRIPVGTCQFTPAADGLFQRAYQAAFPLAGHHRAAAPAAGGGDAAAR